jgi:hypothetical protein
MILNRNQEICSLPTRTHLSFQNYIIIDYTTQDTIELSKDQYNPFRLGKLPITLDTSFNVLYVDLFALSFGQKEPLMKRENRTWVSIIYKCSRAVRDEILLLPIEEIHAEFRKEQCPHRTCQYWQKTPGVNREIYCLLARYRLLSSFGEDKGYTLEQISRIFSVCREWVRRIEDNGLRRLKHNRNIKKGERTYETTNK